MKKLALFGLIGLLGLASFKSRADELLLNGQTNIWLGPVTNNCSAEVERNTEYLVRASSSDPSWGYVTVVGGEDGWIASGETGTLEAVRCPYSEFTCWTGLPSGFETQANANPLEIIVNEATGPVTNIVANFISDSSKYPRITSVTSQGETNLVTCANTSQQYSYRVRSRTNLVEDTGVYVGSEVSGTGVGLDLDNLIIGVPSLSNSEFYSIDVIRK